MPGVSWSPTRDCTLWSCLHSGNNSPVGVCMHWVTEFWRICTLNVMKCMHSGSIWTPGQIWELGVAWAKCDSFYIMIYTFKILLNENSQRGWYQSPPRLFLHHSMHYYSICYLFLQIHSVEIISHVNIFCNCYSVTRSYIHSVKLFFTLTPYLFGL